MLLRVLSAAMTGVFLLCVALQYNDPDPVQWMAIYGAAAIASGFAALRPDQPPPIAAWVVAAIATVWSLTIVPRVIGRVSLNEILGDYAMKTTAVEEAREAIGLLLVALWCVVLALTRARR